MWNEDAFSQDKRDLMHVYYHMKYLTYLRKYVNVFVLEQTKIQVSLVVANHLKFQYSNLDEELQTITLHYCCSYLYTFQTTLIDMLLT